MVVPGSQGGDVRVEVAVKKEKKRHNIFFQNEEQKEDVETREPMQWSPSFFENSCFSSF